MLDATAKIPDSGEESSGEESSGEEISVEKVLNDLFSKHSLAQVKLLQRCYAQMPIKAQVIITYNVAKKIHQMETLDDCHSELLLTLLVWLPRHIPLIPESPQQNETVEALQKIIMAAKARESDPKLLKMLFKIYKNGIGETLPKNMSSAISYLQAAAALLEPQALYLLGRYKLVGLNDLVFKNEEEGLALIQNSAEEGCQQAMMFLVERCNANSEYEQGFTWLTKAAEAGHAVAAASLAMNYSHGCRLGDFVILPSAELALKWLKTAAELGDVNAKLDYGKALYSGVPGVQDPDPKEGITWIERAASQQNPKAVQLLARLLREKNDTAVLEGGEGSAEFQGSGSIDGSQNDTEASRDGSDSGSDEYHDAVQELPNVNKPQVI